MQTYTLLDTRGLLLRSHHADKEKTAVGDHGEAISSWKEGLPIFIENILIPLIGSSAGTAPQDVIAVFDGGNEFRQSIFPDYKLKRLSKEPNKLAGEEIKTLMEKATKLLNYLGIKSVYVPGEEADDLIALLCDRLEADQIMIQTVDKDLLQLFGPEVSIWIRGRTDEIHSASLSVGFKSQSTALVRIHKALCGDQSDGYGGIPRFGPKAFDSLVQSFGEDGLLQIEQCLRDNDFKTIEGAYNASGHPELKRLLEYWSDARLGLELATLHPEVCYGSRDGKPKRPVWSARVPNRAKVLEILGEIGLGYMIGQFEHLFPSERLIELNDTQDLVTEMSEVLVSPVVSWDYESTDKVKHQPFKEAKKKSGGNYVDVLSQDVAGLSINYGKFMEKTFYVPFDHKDTGNLGRDWLTWILQSLDAREGRTVVQNANFELTLSKTNCDYMPRAPFDTAIMASYVDENLENHLKGMSHDWLRYTQTTYQEVTGGRDMCDLTGQEVLSYGCDDSLVTSHLFMLFRTIMQCEGSWKFYETNEVDPAVNDVLDFIAGQEIDYPLLKQFEGESKAAIERATQELHRLVAQHVNSRPHEDVMRSAITLLEEWWLTERPKAGGDPDKETEMRAALWTKAWNSCFYSAPVQVKQEERFSPTVSGLNQVIACLDAAAPRLLKASGPGVEDFDCFLSDYLDKGSHDPTAISLLTEFQRLLYNARKKLGPAARSGPEYDALEAFCTLVLEESSSGKVVRSGDELNIGSNPQMQALLYGKLGLPIRKRSKVTKGSLRDNLKLPGSPATGLKAIEAAFVYDLEDESDWRRQALLDYKEIALESQNQSLYYSSYPLWKHPRDGRVHPQIRNCGTATRRPAGNDPNVLQVSKKGEAKIRKAYPAGDYGDGPRLVVSADFANQELVITGCEARDPVMLDAFMSTPRKDLHGLTSTGYAHILLPRLGVHWDGHQMDYDEFLGARKGKFGEELAKATNQIRNKWSKAVNFLIAYLGGYTTLASNLLIPNELAKTLMSSTFALYPRLQPWQEETIEFARVHGYTQTAYGNRRHATADLYSTDDYLRKRQERQLVNATIQSTAADILKEVRQELVRRKMRDKYALLAVKPVYDEMTASVPFDRVLDYTQELVEVMSITPPGYPVGMAVELSIGKTWGDQVEVSGTSAEAVQKVLDELISL